jgi:hypothetical protein
MHAVKHTALVRERLSHALDVLHAAGRDELFHLLHRCGSRAEFGPAMHERQAPRPGCERERPVERGVAATEDHQTLIVKLARVANAIVNVLAFKTLATLEADAPGLKGAHTRGNDNGACVESSAGGCAHMEAAVLAFGHLSDLLPQMELRVERLDLLHQPVHQLLRAADRERGDVIDGLIRIQLRALTARCVQRIHDMRGDAEKAKLKHLKKPARAGADDDDLRLDWLVIRFFEFLRCAHSC